MNWSNSKDCTNNVTAPKGEWNNLTDGAVAPCWAEKKSLFETPIRNDRRTKFWKKSTLYHSYNPGFRFWVWSNLLIQRFSNLRVSWNQLYLAEKKKIVDWLFFWKKGFGERKATSCTRVEQPTSISFHSGLRRIGETLVSHFKKSIDFWLHIFIQKTLY